MTNSKKLGVRSVTKTKVENALRVLIDEDPIKFKLNMKKLERKSGISRTTLYGDDVKKIIREYLQNDPKAVSAKKRSQFEVETENSTLKKRLNDMTLERDSLLILYSELFKKIYAESAYSACLADNVDKSESD